MTRIGHDAAFAPFATVENGRSTGLVLEVVAEAMRRLDIGFAFVPLVLEDSERALIEGRVDALAFKGDTPERRARLDFSAPIVISGGAVFTRAGLPAPERLEDLRGRTIVTPRRGPLAAEIAKAAPGVKVVLAASYEESIETLLAGHTDAAALNFHAGIRLVLARYEGRVTLPREPFIPIPLAFAVAKGRSVPLLRAFDTALAGMKREGTLSAIERRWLSKLPSPS